MKILAKSDGETLSEHTIACLKAAQAILDALPLPEKEIQDLRRDVILAVALHDVGKAATGFQKVLRNELKDWQGKRHEIISASYASNMEEAPLSVIFAILTHHKTIQSDFWMPSSSSLPPEQIPTALEEHPVWNDMAQEWKENASSFAEEWKEICRYVDRDATVGDLKPLSLDSSWLEKQEQRKIVYEDRYHMSLMRGIIIASDHLGSAHKIPPSIPRLDAFPVIETPRPFQERAGGIDGSAVLRAPTGSGKTEAALLWARRNQMRNGRLFYVLPYMASINAMYRRLLRIFGDANVGILHHRAPAALYDMLEDNRELLSRSDRQNVARVLSGLAKEMWFPIRVCTPHQILRQTLRGKGWEYMLAEFPNACFIFDEIHAYDPRVVGLTLGSARLANQWGARSLFVSATLPSFLRELIADTLGSIPFIEPDPSKYEDRKVLDKKRHNVEVEEGTVLGHIETIVQSIRKHASTLIVCNHVRTSQEIYSILTSRLADENIKLCHSRFNQEDRNRIENAIIKGPLPKVLVATQVVEVSLDVDFEQAFLEPAPIDALIQRMGRVNRTGGRPPTIVTTYEEQVNVHPLYCRCPNGFHKTDCVVALTIEQLRNLRNPISEMDLVEAADKVYGEGYRGEDKTAFDEGFHHPDIERYKDNLLAGVHQDWVEQLQVEGTAELIPRSLLNEYNARKERGLWIEADNLVVPVRDESLAWLKTRIDMSHDPPIADLHYTSERGLET